MTSTLDTVRAAGEAQRKAAARLAADDRARNLAIVAALDSGESLSEVGRTLGLSHVRVLQIARAVRAEGPESETPTAPVGGEGPILEVVTEPESSVTVIHAPQCGRLGCPLPAVEGSRFCGPHGRY